MHVEKTIELKRERVEYALRISNRARGVRLSVTCGGAFVVSAPPWMRQSRIEEFILKKSAWVLQKIAYFKQFPQKIFIRNRARHFAEHKEKARALVEERLAHFNRFYGLAWRSVSIRNQRTRWGSCSRARSINFNYKLALLPPHLADYVIVHELCHLREPNHSQRFWTLVAQTIPEPRRLRRELRKIGVSLL
jgi:predicted metal-dependent hydrolase